MKSLPSLLEFLSGGVFEDGSSREPGSLTIFRQDGLCKLCLSEKTTGLVAFISGKSVTSAFAAAEKGLQGGTLDWRESRGIHGKGRAK